MKSSNSHRNRNTCRAFLLLVTMYFAGGFCFAAHAKPAGKLNVLFIVSDDLNNEVGIYGSIVKTPSLERLATHSVKFDRAYCNYPVCNPSRTSFLSGKRPDTTGVVDNTTPTRAFLTLVRGTWIFARTPSPNTRRKSTF